MLPVSEVHPPAVLAGQQNGQLPATLLVSTAGLDGGPVVRLVEPAARSWRAMSAAALAAGIALKATSVADSYRSLDQQIRTFKQRYTTDPAYDYRPYRRWDEAGDGYAERWFQLPNTAVAAVPGTSNHGLGLAVDVAGAGAPGPILTWLLAHAATYGWSWETQSESWHIRYCTGDAIPAAVLDYERELEAEMAQVLVRFADDPVEPNQVWLCDGQLRRRVKPEWVGANGQGPITNTQVHGAGLLGNLGNNGKVFASGGDKDVWGIDIATLQGGGSAPAAISDADVARIADAVVDEEHDRLAQ